MLKLSQNSKILTLHRSYEIYEGIKTGEPKKKEGKK
jgi:hypothetical protein